MFILFLTIFLPLLEVAGFIIVGGKIGVGWSLLWVIADVIAGFSLLASMGGDTLRKAKKSVEADVYPFEEMFDGFCVLTGALLLIFPGFVSDLLALPLLVTPVRRGIFALLKSQHESVLKNFSKSANGFTAWYYEERGDGKTTVIEGEFKPLKDDKNLLN